MMHRHLRTLLAVPVFLIAALEPSSGQERAVPDRTRLFTLPEHDLYPESIAYDPDTGRYFVGSMGQARIVEVGPSGSYRDFVHDLEGLESSVGIKVDAARRRLWVCTGRYVLFGGAAKEPPSTGVLLIDLDSGEVLGRWLVPQPSPAHIFNDLAIAQDGSVYVTTTLLGRVYHIVPGSSALALTYAADGLQTNGITFDTRGRYLFFTLDRGIVRLDPATGATLTLRSGEPAEAGTDGLYAVPGGLVAIQPRRRRIVRLQLDPAMEAIVGVDTLRVDDPDFAYPTTGVLVADTLAFVATSYADRPRTAGERFQHPDVIIGRLTLATPWR